MDLLLLSRTLLVLLLLGSYQTRSVHDDHKIVDRAIKVTPRAYMVHVQPFPDEDRFIGEVFINILWLESTNLISLNAHRNLTIEDTQVFITQSEGTGTKEHKGNVIKTEKLHEENVYNVIFEKNYSPGDECTIKIKFSGKLNTQSTDGLFKKSFYDINGGESRWIIGSKFEPNLANTVFPCFDDPRFKVPFEVSIQRSSKTTSLSTMPATRSKDMGNGWIKDSFASTPPIAVSSLAIFVSDLTIATDKSEPRINLWTTSELLPTVGQNRTELVHNALGMFEEYFGIRYPVSKIDYIVLPKTADIDVDSNLGLIISSYDKSQGGQYIDKAVISLEIIPQWIGSLVTPSLQNENETIRALRYFIASSSIYKNLPKEDQYLYDHYPLSAMYATYYQMGNPIKSDNDDIRRMGRVSKVELVFRMLSYTLTERTFSATLRNYFKKKQFETIKIEELWKALTDQAHKDGTLPMDLTVEDIVHDWIESDRLPYLTVTRNYNDNSALLAQGVFIRQRPRSVVTDDGKLWKIPIVSVVQSKLDFINLRSTSWMKTKNLNLKSFGDSSEFVIVNPEEIGIFMVNYDNKNWNMLAEFLKSGEDRDKIPVITRAKLVHDALNLAYAGCLDFGTALNMTVHLKDEDGNVPWDPFFNMLDHIARHIDGTEVHKKFEKYARMLVEPTYRRLSSNLKKLDKGALELHNRMKGVLGDAGDESILKEASRMYNKWMQNPAKGYDQVNKYFCPIFKYGTKDQWEFGLQTLLDIQRKPTEIERYWLFKSLVGCAGDSWKIKKFLNMTIFEEYKGFTDDDISYALNMLTGGAGYMATFDYLQENWSALKNVLQNKPKVWSQLIYTATNLFKNQEGLDKVSEFYTKHRGQFGEAQITIEEGLNKIKEEVKWTNENLSNFEEWLDDYIQKNSS